MLLRMVLTVWRWWPTLGGVIYKYIKMLVRMLMTVWRWWWWLTLNGAICSFWKNIKIFLRMVMTVWWWWWLTLGGAICTSPAAGADDTTDLGFRTTTTTHYSKVPHPYLAVWENWYYMLSQVSGIWHKDLSKGWHQCSWAPHHVYHPHSYMGGQELNIACMTSIRYLAQRFK